VLHRHELFGTLVLCLISAKCYEVILRYYTRSFEMHVAVKNYILFG